jgi:hypothetical protein
MIKKRVYIKRFSFWVLLTLLVLTISGCASTSDSRKDANASGEKEEPFVYHSGNEIPEGPGLFTGESGEWTIYRSNKLPWESDSAQQPQQQNTEKTKQKKSAE